MSRFIIRGGKPLAGEIKVGGSKNAVLPMMAASLLTDEECVLSNVPQILDVKVMAEILQGLGVLVEFGPHTLKLRAQNITKPDPQADLVRKFRGSVLLLGPLVARVGRVNLPFPGGDKIGVRPIDSHLAALRALGVLAEVKDNKVSLSNNGLQANKIVLEESSVTATENAIMAACLIPGKTVIKLAACEPHVEALGNFLNKMGAKISGHGTSTIAIEGVNKLHGVREKVISGYDEAASLITLAAATKSDIKILDADPNQLEDFLLKLRQMKVNLEAGENFVHVSPPQTDYQATKLQCGLYPKLNSDFLPPMAVLATQAAGETFVDEWLYENRLGYIPELNKMGAKAEILDPHRVKITGPTPLKGAKIESLDIRMGMTMVIAALVAYGESEIDQIEHIDRGYEDLEGRLRNLGANIKRVDP